MVMESLYSLLKGVIMTKEWRVDVWFQIDPQSKSIRTEQRFFKNKKKAKAFKDQFKNGWSRAYMYHFEPSWTLIEEED